MKSRCPIAVLVLILAADVSVAEQRSAAELLSVDRIYGSRQFAARRFRGRWLKQNDGESYVALEKAGGILGGQNIVERNVRTGKADVLVTPRQLVPAGRRKPLRVEGYAFSGDLSKVLIYTNSQRVWRRKSRGDYWLLDRKTRKLRQLGGTARPATLQFAKFSPQGSHVAYVRERNIYVEDVAGTSRIQLTRTPNQHIINGTFDWVYEEELGLRDGFRWSPDGKSIAYWQIDTTGVQEFRLVNNTNKLYPRIKTFAYPKVGQRNSSCRIGVVRSQGGKTTWLRIAGDPRQHYLARMHWAGNSHELLIQQLNRLQNENRLWMVNLKTKRVQSVFVEKDQAWVDIHDELIWLKEGKSFTWVSERDGWRHVYVVSRDGKQQRLITPGKFDVVRLIHVDELARQAYFIASPEDAAARYLYKANLDTTIVKRVTPRGFIGSHDYQVSPNGRWAIHSRSSSDDPPLTELVMMPQHKSVKTLVTNDKLRRRVKKLQRRPTEFLKVPIGGGVTLDAWCLLPPQLDESKKKKYPLLVYVYGEPAGQTVRNRWSGSGGLWHLMLAQRGYIVMSFDNRGCRAPRGRDFRKSAYRQIGVLAPKDQAAAVRAILKIRPYIDAGRVGVWGWSGGGSSSLHAIFKFPQLYHTAMAIAPVADQRYYDTIYQERYMGLPQDNVKGFRDGSAIHFARHLKGNLLLVHGTGDDNCHYQTTELLINELIRHDKQFTMFAYPNRSHSIREGKNTTRHLRKMMTQYLMRNLPVGAK